MIKQRIITKAKILKGQIQNSVLKLKSKVNWFDIRSHIDTADDLADKESLYNSVDSDNKQYGSRYVPTDLAQLEKSFNQLIAIDKTVLDNTLIDFGCGKGRVLIMAERMGFRNVIGVEYSRQLYDICCNNLKKVNSSSVNVVCGDAVDYQLSADVRVFYFYNPFEYCILEKVLNNIKNSLKANSRDAYIVYIDPRNFGQLNPKEYELLFKDDGPIQPFHIYKVAI